MGSETCWVDGPTEEECAVLEQKLGATADARTATALPGAPSEEVALLIAEEEKFNDKCRGGSGDDSETQKACDERDLLYEKIKAKNWCWGHDGQIGADRTWEPCHLENSVRQANPWTQATPQGQTTATAVSQQPEPSPPKQDIRTVHGADGLDYVFDMNHAVRSQNGTSIPLYIGPPPVVPQKGKESFVGFNCQGGFVMLDNTGAPTSAWGVTRPNSVMGLISKMICATRDIRTIEADNGTVYTFDMSLVHPGAGGIEVMVHDSSQENWEFTGMEFDCAGHFMIEEGNELSEWMYAAPNSVAGKIEEIVCRKPGP